MKIHVVELGHLGEGAAELVEVFEADLEGSTGAEIVEQAIQAVEERRYWVIRNEDGGCCEVREDSDGTVSVAVTVSPVRPIYIGERIVAWQAWCPYCGERIEIDADEISPSAADPPEWAPEAFAELCPECAEED